MHRSCTRSHAENRASAPPGSRLDDPHHSSNKVVPLAARTFHGKKPGYTTACCGDEWRAGVWGQQPPFWLFPWKMPRSLLRGSSLNHTTGMSRDICYMYFLPFLSSKRERISGAEMGRRPGGMSRMGPPYQQLPLPYCASNSNERPRITIRLQVHR